MRICYLDEAGDTAELPSPTSPIQPVFVPAAVIFRQVRLQAVTTEFLQLKQRFCANKMPKTGHYLDCVLSEIKGADIRRNLRSGRRNLRRQTIGFLDRFVDLLEKHEARIVGRVFVEGIGVPVDPRALYTSSVQNICAYFEHLFEHEDDTGLVIADSRTKPQNLQVAHSSFTQKFTLQGDQYERILEMPTYGHSENHVGLQIADLLCSALLFPMATFAYCTGHVMSLHTSPRYSALKARYGARLKRLQYRFSDGHRVRGGIVVCDDLMKRPGVHLFQ